MPTDAKPVYGTHKPMIEWQYVMYGPKSSQRYFSCNERYMASGTLSANQPNVSSVSNNLAETTLSLPNYIFREASLQGILRWDHVHHPLRAHTLAFFPW